MKLGKEMQTASDSVLACCSYVLVILSLGSLVTELPAQTPDADQNRLVAILSLEPIAVQLRNLYQKAYSLQPALIGKSSPKASKKQETDSTTEKNNYLALYSALGKLGDSQNAYLVALRLYVDGKTSGLSYEKQMSRYNSLRAQLDHLTKNLKILQAALEPLRVSMDINTPDVSIPIEDYISLRNSQITGLEVAETLRMEELQDLYSQAFRNNERLDEPIKGLRKLIKDRYPKF